MSNRACIQRCEFVDFPARDVSYGFRAYDDYGQTYLNTATAEVLALDHLDFLAWVVKNVDDEYVVGMLDSVKESERGLYIDDIWWEWEDVRPILSDGLQIECGYGESGEHDMPGTTPEEE
jgi:hypothetical protein